MVFDGWYSDADYTGQKTTFPALIDGDTAFYARRIPISEADNGYMSASIAIDGSVVVADKMKPVHGINNGPVNGIGIFDEPYIDASETRNIRSEETAMSTYTASSPTFPPMKRT